MHGTLGMEYSNFNLTLFELCRAQNINSMILKDGKRTTLCGVTSIVFNRKLLDIFPCAKFKLLNQFPGGGGVGRYTSKLVQEYSSWHDC